MQNTVPATFKTSGAPVTPPATPDPLESALRSAFDQGEPCDADGNPIDEEPVTAWKSLTLGTMATTPVNELLTLLGVDVVEVDPGELAADGVVGYFSGRVGAGEIQIERTLPQVERESVVRDLLARITPAEQSYTKRSLTAPRMRPARLSSLPGVFHLDCPNWCTVDHVEDPAVNLEDVSHSGGIVSLSVPDIDHQPVALLHARLNADPFCSDERLRTPGVQLDEESDTRYMTPAQALQFADDLEAFAAQVRALAEQAGR